MLISRIEHDNCCGLFQVTRIREFTGIARNSKFQPQERRESNSTSDRFTVACCLKRDQPGFGSRRLSQQPGKRCRFAIRILRLHSVEYVRFVKQLRFTREPEHASNADARIPVRRGYDELVEQRATSV